MLVAGLARGWRHAAGRLAGQVRRVTKTIRREMKRRAAIEPVIGHVKAEHRMQRNYLKGCHGDHANAVLAAAGYRSEEHTSELQSLMRISYAVFCLKKKNTNDKVKPTH